MTIYYVDSGATGANNGTSKTDAWTSITSVPTLALGDRVYVSHTHSETGLSTMGGDSGQRTGDIGQFMSVNFSGSTPPVAADITKGAALSSSSGNLTFANSGMWIGFVFTANVDITINMSQEVIYFRDCTLKVGTDDDWNFIGGSNSLTILENCVFSGGGGPSDNLGGFMVDSGDSGTVLMLGCSADTTLNDRDELFRTLARPISLTMIGCDWSNIGPSASTHSINGGTQQGNIKVIGCKFQSGASMSLGASVGFNNGYFQLTGCGISSNTDQEQGNYFDLYHEIDTYGGGISGKAVYRSSGFTMPHQTNAISLRVSEHTAGNAHPSHPTRIPLSVYNTATGATKTLTVEYIAADGSAVDPLDYTEMWLEAFYYDAAGTLLKMETTQEEINTTTPTAHAAGVGTGSWTLTNAETNRGSYKLALTTASNVAQEGLIHVVVCVGDIGTNDAIYIDPMVTIT